MRPPCEPHAANDSPTRPKMTIAATSVNGGRWRLRHTSCPFTAGAARARRALRVESCKRDRSLVFEEPDRLVGASRECLVAVGRRAVLRVVAVRQGDGRRRRRRTPIGERGAGSEGGQHDGGNEGSAQ